jgi:hypothetical protein
MIDLNIQGKDQLTDTDFQVVSCLVSTLEPIKLVVEALCRRDVDLISAEAALKVCLIELQNQTTELAKTFATAL